VLPADDPPGYRTDYPYNIRSRPAFVSVIGGTAIVVAILSLLASAVAGIASMGMIIGSQVATQQAARYTASASVKVAPVGDDAVARDGLAAYTRSTIIDVLARDQRLSEAQQTQLHKLLAKCGKSIFPIAAGSAPSPQRIRTSVSESGRLAGLHAKEDATYFIVGTGKIEVYGDRALFVPNTPGAQTVRVQDGIKTDDEAETDNQPVSTPAPWFAPASPATPYHVRSAATAITMLDAALSAALAIYLLVVGILVLRQHPRGRMLQTIFAILKIPLAIVCAIGWLWAITDHYTTGYGAVASPGTQFAVAQLWMVVFLVAGLAYPIAVLVVMRSRTIKDYYAGSEPAKAG